MILRICHIIYCYFKNKCTWFNTFLIYNSIWNRRITLRYFRTITNVYDLLLYSFIELGNFLIGGIHAGESVLQDKMVNLHFWTHSCASWIVQLYSICCVVSQVLQIFKNWYVFSNKPFNQKHISITRSNKWITLFFI